jgi:hypothetical protein
MNFIGLALRGSLRRARSVAEIFSIAAWATVTRATCAT